MKILSLIKIIYFKFLSPNKVARVMGVNFGKNCHFNTKNFGSEANFIKIGDNFYSASKVEFITHDGSVNVLRNLYDDLKEIDSFKPIIIGNNVFIGRGVTILPGTKMGDNIIVGAASLVRGSLNSNSVYAGVPARYICSIEEYREKNENNFIFTKKMNKDTKKLYIDNWLAENYKDFGPY